MNEIKECDTLENKVNEYIKKEKKCINCLNLDSNSYGLYCMALAQLFVDDCPCFEKE